MPRETFPGCCCQCSCPCCEPLLTHASSEDPPTLAGSFGSVSCGVTTPFLWVLVCTRVSLCPPRLEPLVPLVLWKFYNQVPLIFKVRFPGKSQSLCWILRLGNLMWGSEPSHSGKTSLVLSFSNLWVTHPTGMGFDFIVIVCLLLSCCSLFFDFGCRGIFFWWVPASSCQ